jgi:hypothetical protein
MYQEQSLNHHHFSTTKQHAIYLLKTFKSTNNNSKTPYTYVNQPLNLHQTLNHYHVKKDERERSERRDKDDAEGDPRVHRRKGFVHRLDQETTSFFFTNFPEETKATVLWSKFARSVQSSRGGVYIFRITGRRSERRRRSRARWQKHDIIQDILSKR